MDDCMKTELELAVGNLRSALDFLDRVQASTGDERTAVGTDHWDWLEKAARRVVAAEVTE